MARSGPEWSLGSGAAPRGGLWRGDRNAPATPSQRRRVCESRDGVSVPPLPPLPPPGVGAERPARPLPEAAAVPGRVALFLRPSGTAARGTCACSHAAGHSTPLHNGQAGEGAPGLPFRRAALTCQPREWLRGRAEAALPAHLGGVRSCGRGGSGHEKVRGVSAGLGGLKGRLPPQEKMPCCPARARRPAHPGAQPGGERCREPTGKCGSSRAGLLAWEGLSSAAGAVLSDDCFTKSLIKAEIEKYPIPPAFYFYSQVMAATRWLHGGGCLSQSTEPWCRSLQS